MNRTFFAFAMQHFSLIDLKTFRAVADEGNLTRGAARVHLSPSTVCARIKGLESSLGVPLFTRSAQGMAVTPAGEIVRQGALRIERDIDGMLRDLEPFVSREAGTLRIVSNYGAAMNFLADGLARFLKAHPDVSISHHRCSSRDVVEAVAEDKADIGLSAFVGDYPGVTFIDYARDDLVVIVSIDSPLAHREALDFAECLNENFVSLSEHVEMQRFVDERARELGHKLVPKVRVSNQPILFQMAAAGVGNRHCQPRRFRSSAPPARPCGKAHQRLGAAPHSNCDPCAKGTAASLGHGARRSAEKRHQFHNPSIKLNFLKIDRCFARLKSGALPKQPFQASLSAQFRNHRENHRQPRSVGGARRCRPYAQSLAHRYCP